MAQRYMNGSYLGPKVDEQHPPWAAWSPKRIVPNRDMKPKPRLKLYKIGHTLRPKVHLWDLHWATWSPQVPGLGGEDLVEVRLVRKAAGNASRLA